MCDSKCVTDGPTDLQTDGLQELLEWPLATKKFSARGGPSSVFEDEMDLIEIEINFLGWMT